MFVRFVTLFLLASTLRPIAAYKFLFLVNDITSHVLYAGKLANEVTGRGHQVTFVTSQHMKIPEHIKSNPSIKLQSYLVNGETFINDRFIKRNIESALTHSFSFKFEVASENIDLGYEYSKWLLNDTSLMKKIEQEKFDFVVLDIVLSWITIPYRFGIPSAMFGSVCPGHTRRIPFMPSYVPHCSYATPFTAKMTFYERFLNFIFYAMEAGGVVNDELLPESYTQGKPRKTLWGMVPHLDLCISMRESFMDYAKPSMPDSLSMVTYLVDEPKPLSPEFVQEISASGKEVIIVSFGSWMSAFPKEKMDTLLDAFSQLKEYLIYFKYGGKIDGEVSSNVHVMSWIPQTSLLAHPSTRLFITHCGINGLLESIYNGVPMLAIPFVLDQNGNAAAMRYREFGESLVLADLTADELVSTARRIINTPKYTENIRKAGNIYKELKEKKVYDPVYWMEHVIRHGSKHLRSEAYNMPVYQYYMLDVLAFIFVSVVLIVSIISLLLCKCCRYLLSKRSGDARIKNKND